MRFVKRLVNYINISLTKKKKKKKNPKNDKEEEKLK